MFFCLPSETEGSFSLGHHTQDREQELTNVSSLVYNDGGSVGWSSDHKSGGHRFYTCQGRQYSFVEIDHEIFSMVILSIQLIQEGQLSVPGERICTNTA